MEAVKIARSDEDSADYVFDVQFQDETENYNYKVTFSEDYYKKLSNGKITPEELVRRSFEFMLEREAPGAVMHMFELPIIGRYFPEYEGDMRQSINKG
jgi:hypothetical protein